MRYTVSLARAVHSTALRTCLLKPLVEKSINSAFTHVGTRDPDTLCAPADMVQPVSGASTNR
jgi:hypothetical protein